MRRPAIPSQQGCREEVLEEAARVLVGAVEAEHAGEGRVEYAERCQVFLDVLPLEDERD